MIERLENQIRTVQSVVASCIQACIVLGVLVAIAYCGTIGYYPSGLTLGDSLFFIAASLAFAITYSLVVAALFAAGMTISPVLRWVQPLVLFGLNKYREVRNKPKIRISVHFPPTNLDTVVQRLLGGLVLAIIVLGCLQGSSNAFSLMLAVIVMGLFWGIWNTKPRRKKYDVVKERRLKAWLALLIYMAPFFVVEAKGNFLDKAMNMIGVRSEARIIQLDKKYVAYLERQNIFPSDRTAEGDGIYKDVLIQFRGIGKNVVVKINGFGLTVPAENIIVGGRVGEKRNGGEI